MAPVSRRSRTEPTVFLALDPATSCGFAAWSPGMDKPVCGTFELPSADDDLGRAGFELHVNLSRLLALHRFERVFYEAPIPPSHILGATQMKTTAKAFCIASHIESFCYAMRQRGTAMRCRQVPMGSWRRFFVGKGAGEKGAVFKTWARERCRQLGWAVRNFDEADACGVLAYAVSLDPEFNPPWADALTFSEQFAPKKRAGGRG